MKQTFITLPLFYRLVVNATGEFYVIEHVLLPDDVEESWSESIQPGDGVVLGPKTSTERTLTLRPAPHTRYLELRLLDPSQLLNYWFDEVKPDVEMPDPTPVEIPAHLQVPPSLSDEMRRIVQAIRAESAPEADDIDEEDYEIDSPDQLPTPYELQAMPLLPDVGPRDPGPTPAPAGGQTQAPEPTAPEGPPPSGVSQPQPVSAPSAP